MTKNSKIWFWTDSQWNRHQRIIGREFRWIAHMASKVSFGWTKLETIFTVLLWFLSNSCNWNDKYYKNLSIHCDLYTLLNKISVLMTQLFIISIRSTYYPKSQSKTNDLILRSGELVHESLKLECMYQMYLKQFTNGTWHLPDVVNFEDSFC